MQHTDLLTLIQSRRSIRRYTEEEISGETIDAILEAGRWAPSGLNNQPWRFCIINDKEMKEKLSRLTSYSKIVKGSQQCIAVFYHTPSGYNRDKDLLGIGACIQNMLLMAHALGLGAVWLGEILNKKDEVSTLLAVDDENELLAVIALGYPKEKPMGKRKPLKKLLLTVKR